MALLVYTSLLKKKEKEKTLNILIDYSRGILHILLRRNQALESHQIRSDLFVPLPMDTPQMCTKQTRTGAIKM